MRRPGSRRTDHNTDPAVDAICPDPQACVRLLHPELAPGDCCECCGVVVGGPDDREFTVPDGLAWLGISRETYAESCEILAGRHGNPIQSALLDARDAQGTDTTPADVLARHHIDPADPLAAVRAYDRRRAAFD